MPWQLGLLAMAKAITAMIMTMILPAHIISLLEAFLRITALYTSEENAEDEARSCESAVLMAAAMMAERRIPAMNAGKSVLTILIKTMLLVSDSASPKKRLPIRPTTADMVRITVVQQLPTIWDFFISFSDLIEI